MNKNTLLFAFQVEKQNTAHVSPLFGPPSTAQSSTSWPHTCRTPQKSHKFFPCVCGSHSKISFSSTIYFYSPTAWGQSTFPRPSPGPRGGRAQVEPQVLPRGPLLALPQLLPLTSLTQAGLVAAEIHLKSSTTWDQSWPWSMWSFHHILPLITLPTPLAPDVCGSCLSQSNFSIKGYSGYSIHSLITFAICSAFFLYLSFFFFFLFVSPEDMQDIWNKSYFINPICKASHILRNAKSNHNTKDITI